MNSVRILVFILVSLILSGCDTTRGFAGEAFGSGSAGTTQVVERFSLKVSGEGGVGCNVLNEKDEVVLNYPRTNCEDVGKSINTQASSSSGSPNNLLFNALCAVGGGYGGSQIGSGATGVVGGVVGAVAGYAICNSIQNSQRRGGGGPRRYRDYGYYGYGGYSGGSGYSPMQEGMYLSEAEDRRREVDYRNRVFQACVSANPHNYRYVCH